MLFASFVEGSSKVCASSSASVPPEAWLASAERKRGLGRLAVHLLDEGARRLGEGVAAAGELRGADGAGAGAAGALLAPRLGARPPETRPRLFVANVPARCAFSSARTASWTRCGFTSAAKTASSSATSFALPPWRRAAVPWAPPLAAHLDEPVLRARDRALDEQQVLLGSRRRGRVRPSWVTRLPPIRPAIFMPLKTRDGRRRGADRARRADVVRAVGARAAREVVALDRALEALADADPGDLDLVARLEDLDGDRLALDGAVDAAAELDELAVRADAEALQVPELGPRSASGRRPRRRRAERRRSRRSRRSSPGRPGTGPASITVTEVTTPVSGSKTCVMPSFRPRMPFAMAIRA